MSFRERISIVRSGLFKVLTVRWTGQVTDGIFQSALASFVLFSPERQANPVSAAIAFAVVLLPYSVVGPYVGTLLDQYSRQRIVQFANFARAIDLVIIALLLRNGITGFALTLAVLVAFGINRLILAGLSAGLPLVVLKEKLVGSNALAVTGGTIGVVLGGGIGIGLKKFFDQTISSNHSDSAMIFAAVVGYLLAGLSTRRLRKLEIGPHPQEGPTDKAGWSEMVEGFHILRSHGDSLRAISATAIQRGGLTALTMMVLILERNTFHSSSNPDAGLAGFAQVLTVAGIGIALGAFLAPMIVARIGRHSAIRIASFIGIPALLAWDLNTNIELMFIAAFVLALSGQVVKVTSDALVQNKIHDEYRGRVFAFYDVAVNGAIVSGGLLGAILLPASGDSFALPLIISGLFALSSTLLLRNSKFSAHSL